MTKPIWTFREAQENFAVVVEAALGGDPQYVTGEDGTDGVVVLSEELFDAMTKRPPLPPEASRTQED